ncbi:MAG: YceI family protein [Bacteroidales bacterium]|nr:YceI family protein [Bacteroidales bacterium]
MMKLVFVMIFSMLNLTALTQGNSVFLTETGKIDFVSEAPLEIIRAGSESLKGAIDISKQTFVFVLVNQTFKGFNSPLQQEHFHENYLETNKFPKTTFTGKIIEPLIWVSGTKQQVRAKGVLDLHGEKKERIITATIIYAENSLDIEAVFSIPLEDHQIRIPKVVSKKIATEIKVTVKANLQPNTNQSVGQ